MKEFNFKFNDGNTETVKAVDYTSALIKVYNPQTEIVSFTEKPCDMGYKIMLNNKVGTSTYETKEQAEQMVEYIESVFKDLNVEIIEVVK